MKRKLLRLAAAVAFAMAEAGSASAEILIGMAGALTGPNAYQGAQQGVEMAIADVNAAGGVLGQQLSAAYLTKSVNRECLQKALAACRTGHANYRVLVVEDDPHTRGWLARILREDGWEVAETENGRVALDRLPLVKPDIILLDLMMPEMDGFEFVDEIHRNEETRHLPLIVLTAADIDDEARRRLSGGIRRLLRKRPG